MEDSASRNARLKEGLFPFFWYLTFAIRLVLLQTYSGKNSLRIFSLPVLLLIWCYATLGIYLFKGYINLEVPLHIRNWRKVLQPRGHFQPAAPTTK